MNNKINIAEILLNKPKGTKLYSPLFGIVTFKELSSNHQYPINVRVETTDHHTLCYGFDKNGKFFKKMDAECLLFPSEEMRDWEKYQWKSGDILSCGSDYCIFKEWIDDSYTLFKGLFVSPMLKEFTEKTSDWEKESSKDNIALYICEIERHFGGKLNLDTLEIEKSKFKDGDIVVEKSQKKQRLMNKTRIIRALRSAHILLTDEDDRSDLDCISLAASEISTALEEIRTSSWTSVHVALPPYDTSVLVCNANDPDDMWFSHRSNNPKVVTDRHGFCNYPPLADITHWQKIEKLEKKSK